MSDPLKVFLSHSWQNQNTPEGLEHYMNSKEITLLYDRGEIVVGDSIPASIERMMDQCDVFVPWLTKESIKSLPVRDELRMAYERRKPMVLVVSADATNELPGFLKDKLYFTFDGRDVKGVAAKLEKELLANRDVYRLCNLNAQLQSCFNDLESIMAIGDLTEKGLPRMLYLHAKFHIDRCAEALRGLVSTRKIESDLDTAAEFLKQCTDIFGQADELIAVSRDDVSEFWLSRRKPVQDLVSQYLDTNPKDTIRLFVFKDAFEAHLYHHWLNIHHRFFGRDGAVLVASRTAFLDMLEDLGVEEELLNGTDFGIARFKLGTKVRWYLATLSAGHFSVTPWSDLPAKFKRLREKIRAYATNLEPGTAFEGIGRWEFDLQKDSTKYPKFLGSLFSDLPSTVVHVVLCKVDKDKVSHLRSLLHSGVAQILSELNERHKLLHELQDWRVVTSFDPVVLDPVTHARLRVSEEWPVGLVMRFRSEEGLRLWHAQEQHSHLRREVLEFICPATCDKFREMGELGGGYEVEDRKRQLFSEIQSQVDGAFARMEFREQLSFDETVKFRVAPPQVWIEPQEPQEP